MRRATVALAVTVLLAGPTALAFFYGGYYDRPRLVAVAVAWVLLAAAAVAAPVPLPRSASGRVALAGLALLLVWTAISFAWDPLTAPATDAVQRLLLYVAALAAAIALLRSPVAQRAVEPALAAGAVAVVTTGLSERLLPGVVHLPYTHGAGALGRLSLPFGYWNAIGALAAIGAVLCARIAGDVTRAIGARAAAAAGTVPLAVGTWLSFSRGALAALGIGLATVAILAPTRAQLRAIAIAIAASVPAAVAANAFGGVRGLEGSLGRREGQGAAMLAILVALCAAAAALAWAAARAERSGRWSPAPLALPPRVPVALALALVVVTVGVVALAARSGANVPQSGAKAGRLGSLETDRYAYWRVAMRYGFAKQPLRGIGPGGFQIEWLRHRDVPRRALVPHSLYVETLAELGLVGFAFLVMFIGGVAAGARRARRVAPTLAVGPAAGFVVWAVHSAVDWDWEMPALTLFAVLLGGLLVAAGETPAAAATEPAREVSAAEPAPVAT